MSQWAYIWDNACLVLIENNPGWQFVVQKKDNLTYRPISLDFDHFDPRRSHALRHIRIRQRKLPNDLNLIKIIIIGPENFGTHREVKYKIFNMLKILPSLVQMLVHQNTYEMTQITPAT